MPESPIPEHNLGTTDDRPGKDDYIFLRKPFGDGYHVLPPGREGCKWKISYDSRRYWPVESFMKIILRYKKKFISTKRGPPYFGEGGVLEIGC